MAKEMEYKKVTFLMFLLLVFDTAILISVVVYWRQDYFRSLGVEKTPEKTEFCLPNSSISLHRDDDFENFKKFSESKTADGQTLLCVKKVDDIDVLIQLFVERQYRLNTYESTEIKFKKIDCETNDADTRQQIPAAKVVGTEPQPKENSTSTIQRWHWNGTPAFLTSGTEYVNHDKGGRLRVPETGFYYIYTQITYNCSAMQHENVNPYSTQTLCHLVYKHTQSTENVPDEKLLGSVRSRCKVSGGQGGISSHMADYFYLRKNDEVYVKVSDIDAVSHSPHSNYFGLFKS